MLVRTLIPIIPARIMLVGETPGEVEIASGTPFIGTDGSTLKKILTQAGISFADCIVTNITNKPIRTYYTDKKRLEPTPEFAEQIARLKLEIETNKPNIVIALGALPTYILTGLEKHGNYRGTIVPSTLVPDTKILITQHPKAVHFNWQLFYVLLMDFRKALHESSTPEITPDQRVFSVAPKKSEIITYLQFLYENRSTLNISVDLEHLTPGAHISWLGISHSENYAMSIQFIHNRTPCFPENDEIEIWSYIAQLFSSGIPMVFHNASYDAINLWHNQGVWCKNITFDTQLASHVLWPELPRDLGFVVSLLLNVPAWKHTSGNQYEHGEYNAADAANTRGLYNKMKPLIDADPYFKETFAREMSELEIFGFLQLQGIDVDTSEQERLREDFAAKKIEIEQGLSAILKKEINFNSNQQVQELLYTDMGLPVQYKRRKSIEEPKKITVDADALEKLFIQTQHPVLRLLLEHRKLTKILQFITAEISPDYKAHTSYNISGTETGRLSSSASIILPYGSGNLQNIDHRIRSMYAPPKAIVEVERYLHRSKELPFKTCIIQADYIGAEAHLVANIILDQKLMKAFDNGEDVHVMTTAFMFGITPEEVTSDLRKIGKSIRHATNYSGGPAVVQKKLRVPLRVAKDYLNRFTAITPQLPIWHGRIRETLQQTRTLITPLNRKRLFMDRWGDQLFRSAYAFIPQSTIGDLLNISIVDFYEKYKDSTEMGVLLQLHDAIYIWCKDTPEDRQYWGKKLYESMHRPIKLPHTDLYIGVDFKWGYSWEPMKKLEVAI